MFRRLLRSLLKKALGPLAVGIEHFGSTAVPGLRAKPILDILVGIPLFEEGQRCIPLLEAIGYDYAPQAGIPGDYTFGRGIRRTHLVHVVQIDGPNWILNLRFRDALRRDPSLAQEYEALKSALARDFGHDRAAYTRGKSDFVRAVMEAV